MMVSRNVVFSFFSVTSLLFVSSWLLLPHSTDRPESINNFSTINDSISTVQNQNQVETVIGSRAILADKESTETTTTSESPETTMTTTSESSQTTTTSNDDVKCSRNENLVLKVFMYDLPAEFHFGLLDWKPEGNSVWPDLKTKIPSYPGALNLQHSIEYWLTLDVLASQGTAIRVQNSSEADIIYVPFFSSLSYNRLSKTSGRGKKSRNQVLQEKLVEFLNSQDEWKRSGGSDHLILAHHPNSMLEARKKLWPAILILSDFGRYPPHIANVDKDVIAPYKHVVKTYVNDSSGFDDRPTLLYFQGAIHRKAGGHARQELYNMLKDEKDVHFAFGSVQKGGIKQSEQGMHSSKFCLNIAGDTPSSNRLFDAIVSHCVPVIISDDIELPYEDVLDYSEFCIFVRTRDALKPKFLLNIVRSIGKEEWTRKWEKLKEVDSFFEFQYPSREDDAVQMIWQAVARKVPAMRLKLNRSRRFDRSLSQKHTGLKS